jgi:poly[(R)-3-hydroxyalkanoate] polymerase subunit PhaC
MQPADAKRAAELAKACQSVAERSSRILGDFAQKQAAGLSSAVRDEMGIAKAFMDLYSRMAADPNLMAAVSVNWWIDSLRLWQSSWMRLAGIDAQPVAEPAKGDARFKDDDWSKNFLFDYIKQSYLISARHIQQAVAQVAGLPEEAEKKVAFFTRQYVDALSPSNFLLTNPQVLRETAASGGQNLIHGMSNLLADIEKGGGELRISMTDENAFKLGSNVATTPGAVVFQNDLMQLIQYRPGSAQVYKRPLIIVPPWINKYYILDLREKNSFIRWAVGQGHTVFVVSWVNPDARLAQKGFDDYMTEGPLAALDAVEKATGERRVNFIGYCLGGTLLGATLAYMAAKGQDRVASATFFVSLLDFSVPGELGVFIDEAQVANLERKMNQRGYLEGSEMAGTFNLLRANDLVWSFVVNNYLLGKDPFPFDLLYWNADSTRMPARMHSFYLRNMYIKNLMGVPGGITLAGVPIDLSKVTLPSYFISTAEDHIAPWKGTYRGARYLRGPVRFVLGGSGHIAGIVNPPAAKKYHYLTNDTLPATAEEWFDSAKQHPGSWWEDWQAWIDRQNAGEKVAARTPRNALEDAPGSYAMVRLGAKTS